MSNNQTKPMGLGKIILIMIVAGVAVGALVGLIGGLLGFSGARTGGFVGVAMGVLGAFLLTRRRSATSQQNNP